VAFSPTGDILALAGGSAVRLWSLREQKEMQHFMTSLPNIATLIYFPDGNKLVAGAGASTNPRSLPALEAWDTAAGKKLELLEKQPRGYGPLALSSDGKKLVTDNDDGRCVWDTGTGKKILQLESDSWLISLAFSHDGKSIAGADELGAIHLWDVVTGKEVGQRGGPRGGVFGVAVSPSEKAVAASGQDGSVRLWSLPQGEESLQISLNDDSHLPVSGLAFNAAGTELAVVGASYRLFRVSDGKQVRDFRLPSQSYCGGGHKLYPGGTYLASEVPVLEGKSPTDRPGKVIEVRDTGSGRVTGRVAPDVMCVTLDRDGKLIAGYKTELELLVGLRTTIKVWETTSGKLLRQWKIAGGFAGGALEFSPDGRILAGGGKEIYLWEIATGEEIARFRDNRKARIAVLQFSSDGRTLAAGTDNGRIQLWNVFTRTRGPEFSGHEGTVNSLAFDPAGRLLASGSDDSTSLVWQVSDGPSLSPEKTGSSSGDFETAWSRLTETDAGLAYEALWLFVCRPTPSVAFLKEKLKPVSAVDREKTARLIANLDGEFQAREQATRELGSMREGAEQALRHAASKAASLEARSRIQDLLHQLTPASSPWGRREVRAVQALEYIRTPGARALLRSLAHGLPAAHLTRQAKAALDRLGERQAP
jgi:WD40 repeat protein